MPHTVTATFKTRMAAESALFQLEQTGIEESQIGLLVTDETKGTSFRIDTGTKADEGAAVGATLGGLAGAVLAALAGAGSIIIPGFAVTGALAAGLAGLGAGAAAGGVVGALVGLGIPEHEAKIYEKELQGGSVLLAVHPENKEQAAKIGEILNRTDAYNIA